VPTPKLSACTVGVVLAMCLVIGACAGASIGIGPVVIDTPQRAGTLLFADPGVTIARTGHGHVPYAPGMEVMSGDSIETVDGQAVIDYDDGSAVILNRATRVQLGSITLFFGELFARVKSIATRGGGQVVTNELSASVEGTEYGVRRDLSAPEAALGRVQVYVRDGRVLCAPSERARWPSVALVPNQTLEVAGYRPPSAPRPVDARALSRWADDAERRLRKPRAPEIHPVLTVPIGTQPTHHPTPTTTPTYTR
jgi:ferric-dicitrate binding protein FerR (iron transport regulator)